MAGGAMLPIHYLELEAVYAATLGRGVRTLAVTSAEPGEGVTTLAEALARRAEAAGRRVLLVDLNLFHPALAERFGTPRGAWSPESQGRGRSLLVAAERGLSVLPAPTEGGVGFRERPLMEAAVAEWLGEFDAVLFDTSPLNALNRGNVPAELVCAVCDAALLVVLAGRTSESSLRAAVARLGGAGVALHGAVLNDRFNPGLADELMRETRRLDRWLGRAMEWLRRRIRASALLNAPV